MKMEAMKALACTALLTLSTNALAADPAPAAVSATAPSADTSPAVVAFEAQLQAAVSKGRFYPKESVMSGEQGVVEVRFDYDGNGKATNVVLGDVTASRRLNQATIRAVEKAQLPPKPPELASVVHFHIFLKYTLGR